MKNRARNVHTNTVLQGERIHAGTLGNAERVENLEVII